MKWNKQLETHSRNSSNLRLLICIKIFQLLYITAALCRIQPSSLQHLPTHEHILEGSENSFEGVSRVLKSTTSFLYVFISLMRTFMQMVQKCEHILLPATNFLERLNSRNHWAC